MLDRKTKDRDAGVELLTDRIGQGKKILAIMYLIVIALLLWAGIYYIFTGTIGIPMLILFGANAAFTAFCIICLMQDNTSLLIYFKEREQKNDVKGDKV